MSFLCYFNPKNAKSLTFMLVNFFNDDATLHFTETLILYFFAHQNLKKQNAGRNF